MKPLLHFLFTYLVDHPAAFKATSYTGGTAGKLTGRYTGAGWEAFHYNTMGLEARHVEYVRTSTRDGRGNLVTTVSGLPSGSGGTRRVTYTGDGHMSVNDTVLMARFPGGYFDHTGSPRYYLTDYHGTNVCVLDANGGRHLTMNYSLR